MDSLIGQTLDGRYLVEARIGAGAMGAVYKARHLAMAQPVALKFLLTDQKNDPVSVERFIREARQSFHIDHPNCVRVTDFCATDDGTLFIVMDYLDGRTVSRDIAIDGPLESSRVSHIAAQIAEALSHAHSLGLIHRDLKPDNIMLLQRGSDFDFTKVFDFGLAKLFDEGMMLTGLSMSPLTKDGIVFGTPVYMAPEQALGGSIGPPADVYALGVCCYEMLTGDVPFAGVTFTEVLSKHVQQEPRPPSKVRPDLDIDPQLEALVMSCLQKDAADRPTAEEVAQTLRGLSAAGTAARAPGLASSETLILDAEEIPAAAISASVANEALITKRPKWHYMLFALPAFLVLGIVILATGGSSPDPGVTANARADSGIKAAFPTITAADASTNTGSAAAITVDAGTNSDATVGPSDARPSSSSSTKSKARTKAHLAAAEAAYRSKNLLKQLAEANAALKAQPRNRRAAFLAGDALLKSGDKVRACRFFRRSSRKQYRAHGCEN